MYKVFWLVFLLGFGKPCLAQFPEKEAYTGPNKQELGVSFGVFTSAWAYLPTGLFNVLRVLDATAGLQYRRLFFSTLSWEAGLHYQRSHFYADRGRPQQGGGYLRLQDLSYLAVPLRLNYQSPGKTGFSLGIGTQIQGMLQGRQEWVALGLQNQTVEVKSAWRDSRVRVTPWVHTGFNHQLNAVSNLRLECSWDLMRFGLGEPAWPLIQLTFFSRLPEP
ncbi:MAG: hypothetical protein ACK417_09305 [Bacteroidia bacterium]